ncbi:MAG: D-lyxose/D-mannose family sugar isomerase [Pseudomonadota bacterium]
MQRSQINTIIREAHDFISSFRFALPPFAHWGVDEMRARKADIEDGVLKARLGWDITDFGQGDFAKKGLFLFTVRNGDVSELKTGGMCYAEKIMMSRHDQVTPMHRHVLKTEDIINRGGAKLAIRMNESGPDGKIDKSLDVPVTCDGVARTLKGGDVLVLEPGESVTLRPGNWHTFWGEGGDVLIGEVSTVNDDVNDNVFAEPVGRFSTIEEDEEPYRLLVSDYDTWLSNN